MKIFCQVVVKNEADRFWDSWLDWHVRIFPDGVHIFDDNSDDETVSMALAAGATVSKYGPSKEGPTFLEHEGKFRQEAWRCFENAFGPEPGDWVFCIDSDEFFVARNDELTLLYEACTWANENRRSAYTVVIPEVFYTDIADDGLLSNAYVRTDGWWGTIAGTRLFPYQRNGEFADKPMASGSEPTYVAQQSRRSTLQHAWLMHYGYSRPEDVKAKFERYSKLPHGHANKHIQSIVEEPDLTLWEGPRTDVYYGRRPEPGPERAAPVQDEEPVEVEVPDEGDFEMPEVQ